MTVPYTCTVGLPRPVRQVFLRCMLGKNWLVAINHCIVIIICHVNNAKGVPNGFYTQFYFGVGMIHVSTASSFFSLLIYVPTRNIQGAAK